MLLSEIAVTAILGTVWCIDNAIDVQRKNEFVDEMYRGKNFQRQHELYKLFYIKGVDVNGQPIREPRYHPKEAQRLVRRQMEKEGWVYDNEGRWNLDYCVFDKDGRIVSIAGEKVVSPTYYQKI